MAEKFKKQITKPKILKKITKTKLKKNFETGNFLLYVFQWNFRVKRIIKVNFLIIIRFYRNECVN